VSGRVLVAGIGNVFLGDDGFGVEVAHRLRRLALPESVRVEDFGIRGVHLAYELLDGYDTLVLVDAVSSGEEPGTLTLMEAGEDPSEAGPEGFDAHSMNPGVVLATLAHLGGRVGQVIVVGCEPAVLDEGMGLSPRVSAAVEPAVDMCREVLDGVCGTERSRT
jgi:hydrogenase maturation protease